MQLITEADRPIVTDPAPMPAVSRRYTLGVALGDYETNAGYRQIRDGVQRAAAEAGVELILVGHHETRAMEQAAAVEAMLASEVDALILVPLNEYTLSPVAQRAVQQGHTGRGARPADGGVEVTAHVGADNRDGGRLAARFLARPAGRTRPRGRHLLGPVHRPPARPGFRRGDRRELPGHAGGIVSRADVGLRHGPDGSALDVPIGRHGSLVGRIGEFARRRQPAECPAVLRGIAGHFPELPPDLMRFEASCDFAQGDLAAQCVLEGRYLVINDPLASEKSLFGVQGDLRRALGKFVMAPLFTSQQEVAGVVCLGRPARRSGHRSA